MTLAIMQPYFFPYIGYYQMINAVDQFVIFDDVNFIKKGYINRNSLLSAGKAQTFTLELIKASQNKLINEITIGHNQDKILKTIEFSYKKAPYFEDVMPLMENIMKKEEENLAKFLANSLVEVSSYLNIDTKFLYSSEIEKENALKAQDKILDICKRLNATHYINAIGGQELYDKKIFEQEDIQLNFIETEITPYKQFKNEFVPYLSIIDVMMFNRIEEVKRMLMSFKLV